LHQSSFGAPTTRRFRKRWRGSIFVFFDDEARFEESTARLADALSTDIEWIRKHTEFGELARRWRRPRGRAGCC